MRFQELKRALKKNLSHLPPVRLAVLGDTATQMLALAIQGYAYGVDVRLEVLDAPYDQIEAQLLDPQSQTRVFAPEYALIYRATEALYARFSGAPPETRPGFAQQVMEETERLFQLAEDALEGCTVLQCTYVEWDDGVFGNFAAKTPASFLYQVRLLNVMLMEAMVRRARVFPVDLAAMQNTLGRTATYADPLFFSTKTALTLDTLPWAAKRVIDTVRTIRGQAAKCIVLDLDGTLWGGVIGDDGMEGIEIGELGRGPAFLHFQRWLKQLRERGILLAVCSKNDEATAKEPFLRHPEMVLRLEDLVLFVANWENKADNIRWIQQTLNLGMDAFVFLDDNPFERNLVRSMIPEISVPELPEDPAEYVTFLSRENLFETTAYTGADGQRTHWYQAEAGRRDLEKQYHSIDEYLRQLEMRAGAAAFDEFHVPRIAQLTQRSNQFNLRTVRYTQGEILGLMQDAKYVTRYFTLRDRFGDHGLVGLLILRWEGEDTLFVENWIMSCRVLKRGMEETMTNTLLEVARAAGARRILGEYLPTPKNGMVRDLYGRMGFSALDGGHWEIRVADFRPLDTAIEKEGETA